MAISVDLPEPEGPTRATNSPADTVRSMPRRACTALPLLPKTLVSCRVSMISLMATSALASVVLVVFLDLLAGRVLEADLLAGREAGEHLDALQGGDAGGD